MYVGIASFFPKQDDMISSLRYKPPAPSTNSSSTLKSLRKEDNFYFPTICEGLQKESDRCYAVKLQQCYDDHDVAFHMAYLLEDLKTNGAMLTSHIITGIKVVKDEDSFKNLTRNSSYIIRPESGEITVDISDCPIFDGALKIQFPKR